jgi:hypothetical protein
VAVGAINGVNVNSFKSISFKGKNESSKYENPISRGTEKNLAILSTVGLGALVGAVAYGLTSCVAKTKKTSVLLGLAATAVTLLLTLPSKLYNTKVNAFVKEKEMDVFSRDRELKSNLTEEVHNEVKDPDVSLDKKLDDNLKLQMANRGSAVGIANLSV